MNKILLFFLLPFTLCGAANIHQASESNNKIAADLYQEISKEEGNVFFSPISLSTAMSLPYIGARNGTLEQMSEVLHFDSAPEENAASYGALMQHLMQGNCTSLIEMTNSLWVQEEFPVLNEFVDCATHQLFAGVQTVDFVNETAKALSRINGYVESATRGQIKNLLNDEAVTTDTRTVLINTIYLKAQWKNPFDEHQTYEEPFYLEEGSSKNTSMMHRTGKYLFRKSDGYSVLELPYTTERCAMVNLACYIVLPDREVALSDIKISLDELFTLSESRTVAVSVPKFSLETTIPLKKNLESLGLTLPFSYSADFSGISGSGDLFISEVIQKAKLKFEETGTEASAATAVVMDIKSLPVNPIEFRANRPFFFVIADKTTRSVLFSGRLEDPKS